MEKTKTILTNVPHATGVYIFKDSQDVVLYVGKAVNLAKRVRQYFQKTAKFGKTAALVDKIAKIKTIKTASEFDALLLEAKLIHDLGPRYNVVARDDKSPIYIVLTTNEELPRVLLVRKTGLPQADDSGPAVFGPFQSTTVTRALLRSVRHIIPFCTQKERNGRPCFYTYLHLCDPCPSVIAKLPKNPDRQKLKRVYRRNIMRLKALLSGKEKITRRELEKEMRSQAEQNLFEEAELVKRQLQSLSGLASARFDPNLYLTRSQLVEDTNEQELAGLRQQLLPFYPDIGKLDRIEGIDVSNTGGTLATGSLVVLTRGLVDTREYRKFKIKRGKIPNDTAMIAEVITRRLKHPEWPLPNLLVIDGGKGQVRCALESLKTLDLNIPVIGLSKRFEEIVVPKDGKFKLLRLPTTSPTIHVLERIRDEAHRFAKSYHVLLRAKTLRQV